MRTDVLSPARMLELTGSIGLAEIRTRTSRVRPEHAAHAPRPVVPGPAHERCSHGAGGPVARLDCHDCDGRGDVAVVLADGDWGPIDCPTCVPNDALGG